MHNFVSVEILGTVQDLPRHRREEGLGHLEVALVERAFVHVSHQKLDIPTLIGDVRALEHVWGIHFPHDLHLSAGRDIVFAMGDLERVEGLGTHVSDLVYFSLVVVAQKFQSLKL